ncbi:hypothetical protein K2173_012530 [Erythroxylum novogranatense]|uniref:Uncharacterized protein n=1 Tax=Erythroxylum novogranatense TaxID=1862640 RepID=A0AAV8TLJ0_9ROSI|nr:hypothetical protein K2173_012530 [Erythroxylum novogranatense]
MAVAGSSSSLRVISQFHNRFMTSPFPSSNLKFHINLPKPYSLPFTTQPLRFQVQTFNSASSSSSSTPATSLTPKWAEFAANISGEWDGFGADFTSEGKPVELPEMVVPEAYREWEVKVFDWQTQCPTLAHPNHLLLSYKTIKLLPTVGCEADAATRYSVNERTVVGGSEDNNHKCIAFAYESSGCYVSVWPIGIGDDGNYKDLELEYCLINPKDRESRVRIFLKISMMRLASIGVFCEQWYGPFRNGEQLGGCAIRDAAFASTPPLKASEISGVWEGLNAVASFHESQTLQGELVEEVIEDGRVKTVREEEGEVVLLPKQLWCCHREISSKEETWLEVGWLLDPGFALTSKCIFSSNQAKLKAITLARETRIMDGV